MDDSLFFQLRALVEGMQVQVIAQGVVLDVVLDLLPPGTRAKVAALAPQVRELALRESLTEKQIELIGKLIESIDSPRPNA